MNSTFKDKSVLQFFIVLNFSILSIFLLDVMLPSIDSEPQKLESIYSARKYFSGYRSSGGYELVNLIELQNGELYRIGILPGENIEKGQLVITVKSSLFGKVNAIKVKQNYWRKISVSYLSNIYLSVALFLSFLTNLVYPFMKSSVSDFLLALSSMFIYFFCGMYFFYI